jgi:hypothetical protein
VSVFLRWGVFGILGVAALVYAYNASKRMAERQTAKPVPAATTPAPQVETRNSSPPAREVRAPAAAEAPRTGPPHCEAELVVAQRAIEMRKQGEPLDRVLRIQEVAWQEPAARRERLEKVATRWYGYEGEFVPEALRIAVISDCVQHSPAP